MASGTIDLKSPGFGARAFARHAGRSALKRLATKSGRRIPACALRRCHEHLAGFQPAMIVGAAKDFPVRAPDELGFGEQPPQADQGKPPLGQTVNKPAPPSAYASLLRLCIARGCLSRGSDQTNHPRSTSSIGESGRGGWVPLPCRSLSAAAWTASSRDHDP